MIEPGERVTFTDGYTFLKTFHGPMILTKCVDCGHEPIGVVAGSPEWLAKAKCSGCYRKVMDHGFGLR